MIDRLDWAFANIASQIETHLSDEFSITILSAAELDSTPLIYYILKDYDIVHYFWRGYITQMFKDRKRNDMDYYFGSSAHLKQHIARSRNITTSVYDHLFLTPKDIAGNRELFNDLIAGYTVSSRRLQDIYGKIDGYPPPSALVTDGVDLKLFRPENLTRLKEVSRGQRALKVGWVGNSEWAKELKRDAKGMISIIKPAIEELRAGGALVEAVFADRKDRHIPHHRMPDYYATIDVLVCASEIEGTPNPVLEAMACGVPVISTDVGIVPEALGELQRRFILPTRSKDALKAAIRGLMMNDDILTRLSDENLVRIKAWDWPVRCEAFRSFFRQQIANRRPKPMPDMDQAAHEGTLAERH